MPSGSERNKIASFCKVSNLVGLWQSTVLNYESVSGIILQQGQQGVPVGGHVAGHCADLWACVREHLIFSSESEVRQTRQEEWQKAGTAGGIASQPRVTLPDAKTFVCTDDSEHNVSLRNVWAAKNRHEASPEDIRKEGLNWWRSPYLKI